MLPYATPLHHLLMREWGVGGVLVMTSGNLGTDEPIATGEPEVV